MLDESRLNAVLDQARSQLRDLDRLTSPTSDDVLAKIRLQERIETLQFVLGEERKKELRQKLKELKPSELEVIRGSILVLEQLLVTRGFTNQEELQNNLYKAIEYMRKRTHDSASGKAQI